MSTLALRAQVVLPSPSDMWNDKRPMDLPSRPRSGAERVELPSIRQAVPEIQLRASRDEGGYRNESSASYSPKFRPGPFVTIPVEHPHSPTLHKRRKLSSEEDQESDSRDHFQQRLYRSPPGPVQCSQSIAISPSSSVRRASTFSTSESWASLSSRNSPYMTGRNAPGMRASPSFEPPAMTRSDWRPTLPNLPSLPLDHGAPMPRSRSTFGEYALDSRPGAQTYPQHSPSTFDPPPSAYHHPALSYGYQQPRGQSYSGPSYSLAHERTPFSGNHHCLYPSSSFPYGMEGMERDEGKQRKRRGNLPKETTDKLRAWFVAHLQHPYPTEDEKQELMRQTGLQMNQISNWFINARRRQLPAMINNARAESDARTARSRSGTGPRVDGADALNEATSDYGSMSDEREKRNSVPLGDSEGEGSVYDEEFEPRADRAVQPTPTTTKTESD